MKPTSNQDVPTSHPDIEEWLVARQQQLQGEEAMVKKAMDGDSVSMPDLQFALGRIAGVRGVLDELHRDFFGNADQA